MHTSARLQLRLVHLRYGQTSVSVQEGKTKLHIINSDDISTNELELREFDLDLFQPGRHELELIVTAHSELSIYGVRDVQVKFLDNAESDAAHWTEDELDEVKRD